MGSLRRNEGGAARFLESVAEAWVAGVDVRWAQLLPAGMGLVDLPTYAFQRQRYWPEPAKSPRSGGTSDPVDAAFWGLLDGEVADVASRPRAWTRTPRR